MMMTTMMMMVMIQIRTDRSLVVVEALCSLEVVRVVAVDVVTVVVEITDHTHYYQLSLSLCILLSYINIRDISLTVSSATECQH